MSLERADELGVRRWSNVGDFFRRVLLGDRVALFLAVDIPVSAEGPFRRMGGFSITRILLTPSADITCIAYRYAVRALGYQRSLRRLFYCIESANLGVDL